MARVEQSYSAHTKAMSAKGVFTSVEIPYVVFEVADEDAALSAVLAETPKSYGALPLESVEIDSRENDFTYKVNAIYKKETTTNDDGNDDDDEPESMVSFDCGGGAKHMTHSLKQTIAFGTKDAGGAIGWNGKSGSEMEITGIDIPTAQLRETYTREMKLSRITTSFKRNVATLVGKVNSGSFKGWSAGEVMFLGMSYSCPDKRSTKVSVAFNFAIQPNESDAKVGGNPVSKKGFEYVWALSKTSAENGAPKAEVEAIYVDQVCEYTSFGALGL